MKSITLLKKKIIYFMKSKCNSTLTSYYQSKSFHKFLLAAKTIVSQQHAQVIKYSNVRLISNYWINFLNTEYKIESKFYPLLLNINKVIIILR